MKESCTICHAWFEYAPRKGDPALKPPKVCSSDCFRAWIMVQEPGPERVADGVEIEVFTKVRLDRRSAWEVKFEEWLQSLAISYRYEPLAFRLVTKGGPLPYVPDYQLGISGVWVEVKGQWLFSDRLKVTTFREQVNQNLVVADLPFIMLLRRTRHGEK